MHSKRTGLHLNAGLMRSLHADEQIKMWMNKLHLYDG